jgi:hypothetical protein
MQPIHCFVVVLGAFAATLAAQASKGPVLALPHGFSVDPTTVLPGISKDKIGFADIGIDAMLPPQALPPGMPDFATYLGGIPVDVDALSLGIDWVVSDPVGAATVGPGQWAAITFTVTRTTAGLPGSVIASAVAEPDGAAADVFGYVLPGSNLPPVFVGVPFRAQNAPELAAALAVAGNLDAHDLYIALLYLENPLIAATLPPPTVFFSVTAASVPLIPMAWTAVPALRSGATVFATTWSPVTSTWSMPIVDLVHGLVLFSTSKLLPPPTGPRNPILLSVLGSGTHSIYHLPGGSPISTEVGLGLGVDDIDGICSLDPGQNPTASQIRLPFQLGTIGPALPTGLPTQLQASAWRHFDPATTTEVATTWMTGWPPPGTPQPSLAIVGGALGSSSGPYVVLSVFVRPQPSNPFAGHPEHFEQPIPNSISMLGTPLWFLWGALSNTTFDVSHPVGISTQRSAWIGGRFTANSCHACPPSVPSHNRPDDEPIASVAPSAATARPCRQTRS